MPIRSMVTCSDRAAGQLLCNQLAFDVGDEELIAAEFVDLAHVLGRVAAEMPDVLLFEISADEHTRWDMMGRVRKISARTRIITLSPACTQPMLIEAIKQGAKGCVVKPGDASLCARAVRAVHGGETWYGRTELLLALQSQVCVMPSAITFEVDEEGPLTPREEQILHLIGAGLSNKEIARQLDISDKTVKTHLHRVYVKLKQSGRYKAFLAQPEQAGFGRMALGK